MELEKIVLSVEEDEGEDELVFFKYDALWT